MTRDARRIPAGWLIGAIVVVLGGLSIGWLWYLRAQKEWLREAPEGSVVVAIHVEGAGIDEDEFLEVKLRSISRLMNNSLGHYRDVTSRFRPRFHHGYIRFHYDARLGSPGAVADAAHNASPAREFRSGVSYRVAVIDDRGRVYWPEARSP